VWGIVDRRRNAYCIPPTSADHSLKSGSINLTVVSDQLRCDAPCGVQQTHNRPGGVNLLVSGPSPLVMAAKSQIKYKKKIITPYTQ
jgi:hypothetical protein